LVLRGLLGGFIVNKGDLVDALADHMDITKTSATDAVNTVFDTIKKALAAGHSVNVAGFGSFNVKQRKARIGRNPKTGDPIQIAASKAATFKAGKALKDAVN